MAVTKKYPEPLVFGLDIGTRSIVGTVGYKDLDKFNVVAMDVRYHDTRSMIDGQIHDIAKVSEDIAIVKRNLEQQLGGRKLTEVCIAAAGRVLKTAVGHGVYEFQENTMINQEHIHSIDLIGVEEAHSTLLKELSENSETTKYYCVGYTVIKYFLNDYEIHNLEGHKGTVIAADVLATFLPEEVVGSLYTAVENSGLSVTNLTLEPIAAINVAIPENYRLLNIALVDVGAGTSDICITKDGSIIGYGMIPSAGDELTEVLIKEYLIDFATAEKLKTAGSKKKSITYKDIMGISHKITPDEIAKTIEKARDGITAKIAAKIKELNGGDSVSAVFVVGGGGKLKGFTENIAKALKLPEERVALRGSEVMGDINFLVEDFKKDSLFVTPVGICLNFFDQKNNFIFVTVNGQRVKLYNNDRLTVFDAAHAYGLKNNQIFPGRGSDITFKINGRTRIVRGYDGEPATITKNDEPVGMNTAIAANDRLEITESTVGQPASVLLSSLPEYNGLLNFDVNGIKISCPKFALVNGSPKTQSYEICDGDDIEMQGFYTLEQLLVFMDVEPEGKDIFVNNAPADMTSKIFDNFVVSWTETREISTSADEVIDEAVNEAATVIEAVDEADNDYTASAKTTASKPVMDTKTAQPSEKAINVKINGLPYTLKGKNKYTYVDILDVYPFDVSVMGGTSLATLVNSIHVDFSSPINAGDEIEIYWVK